MVVMSLVETLVGRPLVWTVKAVTILTAAVTSPLWVPLVRTVTRCKLFEVTLGPPKPGANCISKRVSVESTERDGPTVMHFSHAEAFRRHSCCGAALSNLLANQVSFPVSAFAGLGFCACIRNWF